LVVKTGVKETRKPLTKPDGVADARFLPRERYWDTDHELALKRTVTDIRNVARCAPDNFCWRKQGPIYPTYGALRSNCAIVWTLCSQIFEHRAHYAEWRFVATNEGVGHAASALRVVAVEFADMPLATDAELTRSIVALFGGANQISRAGEQTVGSPGMRRAKCDHLRDIVGV
jgi:hypothetical protein